MTVLDVASTKSFVKKACDIKSGTGLLIKLRLDFKRHMKKVLSESKYHKCNLCDKSVDQMGSLRMHMLQIHTKRQITIVSFVKNGFKVGEISINTWKYFTMRQNHHKCNLCDKGGEQRENLNAHTELIHDGRQSTIVNFVMDGFKQENISKDMKMFT